MWKRTGLLVAWTMFSSSPENFGRFVNFLTLFGSDG